MTRTDLARADEIGSGIPSGTSFPVSPSLDDLFHRTDRDLIYFYDGTRWLTVNEYEITPSQQALFPVAAATALLRWPVRQDYSMYLVRLDCVTFVTTTNSGAHYWTCTLKRRDAANNNTDIGNFNTSADTPSNWVNHTIAINAVLDSSARELNLDILNTGSPGTIYVPSTLIYRLVG
jgi:hypothetical protein